MEMRGVARKLVVFISTLTLYQHAHAQGGWDIGYLHPDSLTTAMAGKEIRIDFRSNPDDVLDHEPEWWEERALLFQKSTVNLKIGNEPMQFREDWEIYDDWGFVNEQTLRQVENDSVYIREMFLVAINETTITVEVFLYHGKEKTPEIIHLDKSMIKGYIVKV